jgi:ribosomal protein L40E
MLKRAALQAEIWDVANQDCARCGATLADGAQWCSLCYAPVLDKSLPDAPPRGAAGAPPSSTSATRTDTYPSRALVAESLTQLDESLGTGCEDEPNVPAAQGPGAWPCLGCGAANPMGENVCAACGLSFLAQAKTPPSFNVPLVGDIFLRPRPQQVVFIAVTGVALLGVLLGLMTLFGTVL